MKLREQDKITRMDDDYFYSLADYSDMSKAISWSEKISTQTIFWYRTLGMLSFYAVSYLVRPWRPFQVLSNLLRGRQESRMERALSDIFQRRYSLAADTAPSSSLVAAAEAVVNPPYV